MIHLWPAGLVACGAPRSSAVAAGDTLPLAFDRGHIHRFDAAGNAV